MYGDRSNRYTGVCVSAKPFNDNRKGRPSNGTIFFGGSKLNLVTHNGPSIFFTTFRPFSFFVWTWRQKCSKHSRQPKSAQSAALFVTATAAVVKKSGPPLDAEAISRAHLAASNILSFVIDVAAVIVLVGAVNRSKCFVHFQVHFMEHRTLQLITAQQPPPN